MIRSFQLKISNQVQNQLIVPILDSNSIKIEEHPENMVRMKFNSVTDADEAVKAKWLGDLLRGYDARRGEEKPFTDDEVRAMFGYGPKPVSESSKKPKPDKEPDKEPDSKPSKEPNEEEENEEE